MTNALARKDKAGDFLAALARIAQDAAPKAMKADAETESANEAAKREGAVGALFGEEVQVAIPEDRRNYKGALQEAMAGVSVKDTAQVRSAGGRVTREVRGEKDLGNGLVQEVRQEWRVGAKGEVKALVVREGKVKVSKGHALFGILQEADLVGAYYTGGGSVNGASVRKVRILQQEGAGFRVVTVHFDTNRKIFATQGIHLADYAPCYTAKGEETAAWRNAQELLALAEQAGRIAPLPTTEGEATGDE